MIAPHKSAFVRFSEIDADSLLAGAALMVALVGISAASILIIYAQSDLGSNAITVNRLGLATLAFALWQGWDGFRDRHSELSPTARKEIAPNRLGWAEIGLLLLAGTSFSASLIVWSWSMTETSIANATLLENMMPLFTTLGGWLFLGQRFSRKFLTGMGIAILGAIAIGLGDLSIPENHLIGDFAALLSAMFASTSLLSVEKLRNHWSTAWIMTWVCLIGTVFAFIPMAFTESHWLPSSWICGLAVFSLAIISQFLGQGLLTFCLTRFSLHYS